MIPNTPNLIKQSTMKSLLSLNVLLSQNSRKRNLKNIVNLKVPGSDRKNRHILNSIKNFKYCKEIEGPPFGYSRSYKNISSNIFKTLRLLESSWFEENNILIKEIMKRVRNLHHFTFDIHKKSDLKLFKLQRAIVNLIIIQSLGYKPLNLKLLQSWSFIRALQANQYNISEINITMFDDRLVIEPLAFALQKILNPKIKIYINIFSSGYEVEHFNHLIHYNKLASNLVSMKISGVPLLGSATFSKLECLQINTPLRYASRDLLEVKNLVCLKDIRLSFNQMRDENIENFLEMFCGFCFPPNLKSFRFNFTSNNFLPQNESLGNLIIQFAKQTQIVQLDRFSFDIPFKSNADLFKLISSLISGSEKRPKSIDISLKGQINEVLNLETFFADNPLTKAQHLKIIYPWISFKNCEDLFLRSNISSIILQGKITQIKDIIRALEFFYEKKDFGTKNEIGNLPRLQLYNIMIDKIEDLEFLFEKLHVYLVLEKRRDFSGNWIADIRNSNEKAVLEIVKKYGPLFVGVDYSNFSFSCMFNFKDNESAKQLINQFENFTLDKSEKKLINIMRPSFSFRGNIFLKCDFL